MKSFIIQHEIDHLDGILFIDKVTHAKDGYKSWPELADPYYLTNEATGQTSGTRKSAFINSKRAMILLLYLYVCYQCFLSIVVIDENGVKVKTSFLKSLGVVKKT